MTNVNEKNDSTGFLARIFDAGNYLTPDFSEKRSLTPSDMERTGGN
jgi:hypothetical protein